MSATIIARFKPRPGAADSVERILRAMITPTRNEPGCQRYDLYRTGTVEVTGFCLIERYADDAAVQAHRDTAHYKLYRANIMDLLAQPIEVESLKQLDVCD